MPTKLKLDERVYSIDLTPWTRYVDWHPNVQYLNLAPGTSPYKLLHYLARQLPAGSLVTDCGTLYGCSALAMASSRVDIEVHTWDIHDCIGDKRACSIDQFHNIHRHVGRGCFDGLNIPAPWSIEKSLLIYLDIDPHDGDQEFEFVEKLAPNFHGLLICDDINLNYKMKRWWMQDMAGIGYRRIDLTLQGHHAGTGAVVFDPEVIDLEVTI